MLHAVRVGGVVDEASVAARAELTTDRAHEVLLDFEACGWVRHSTFAGSGGWSLTDAGKARGEFLLQEQLCAADGQAAVRRAFTGFVALNAQFLEAITAWQLRSQHDALLDDLAAIVRSVYPLLDLAAGPLPRFAVYRPRLSQAVGMALVGAAQWVDGLEVDSVHRVWFELHEDFLATLGMVR